MAANVALETCTASTFPGRDCYSLTATSLGLKQLLFPVYYLTQAIKSAASTCTVHPLPQGIKFLVLGVKQLNRKKELRKRGRGVWGVVQEHGELLCELPPKLCRAEASACIWGPGHAVQGLLSPWPSPAQPQHGQDSPLQHHIQRCATFPCLPEHFKHDSYLSYLDVHTFFNRLFDLGGHSEGNWRHRRLW